MTIIVDGVMTPNPAVTTTTRRREVVVAGVDDTPPSIAAARWAAEEAHRTAQQLQLVHSCLVSLTGFPGYDYRADLKALVRSEGRALLARTADELRRRIPGLEVTTTLERADPRRSLVEASEHASVTVLGGQGEGHRHVGAVTSYVTAHAVSPVAVVPPDTGHPDGPVLVGVNGSTGCQAAIGYAFDEADARGADLFALHAWDDPALQWFARRPVRDDVEEQQEHALLTDQLTGWPEKHPDVTVRQYVMRGRPGPALLRCARHAPLHPQMIVVGGHGRGGLAGFLLGSTGHILIGHADCPVVVVRPDPSRLTRRQRRPAGSGDPSPGSTARWGRRRRRSLR
ncbi:MAG TPA: universal stress protein [Nakamurella sp.]|jgi:nucleotide-binding universal stress UspA family protein